MERTCQATKKDGSRCNGRALSGSGRCWAHDESLREVRDAGRRQGGHGRASHVRAAKRMSPDLTSLLGTLHDTIEGVRSGDLSPAQGSAIGSLARAVVAVTESATLEVRLEELRTEVARLQERPA